MSFLKNITASPLSDAALVQQYRQTTDLKTLGALYERYMDLVYGVCLNYLKDSEQAKDSVLSIFEELVVKLQRYEVEHFKAWLYQLAKNHCLMQLRADKKLVKVPGDVALMQKEESWHLNGETSSEEKSQALQECLAQLNDKQREAVDLFYMQEKPYKEMAQLMGVPVDTVRSFLQNGRRNLKTCMDKKITVA